MKVVLIDDVKTNLMILELMLKKFKGVKSISFEHPVRALEWCKNNHLDLIITDYMMPEIDGIKLSKKLREYKKEDPIPIIMITAHGEEKVKMEALNSGITDFLTKPVNKAEFQARVKNLLKLREYQLKISNRAEWLEEEVKKATIEIENREEEIIFRLSRAAEYRDDDTGHHIKRMAFYSYTIAQALNLDKKFTEMLLKAAPMHDVGKISIPDRILLKPGKLTKEEFEIIKTHTLNGYKILENSNIQLLNLSAEIALTHHEKFNGEGYPYGLKGNNIPISGRICAVADVFDALTSKRPYKEAWSVEKSLNLLKEERGKHFDPDCIDAFFNVLSKILEIKERYKG